MRPAPVLLAALLASAPAAGRAAGRELELEAELGTGLDGNADRAAGPEGRSGQFASARVRAKGRLTGDRLALSASLAGAGRLYPGVSDASALASRLEAAARLALTDRLSAGAQLLASDLTERGHRLDQDLLQGAASVDWAAGRWGASLSAGWTLLLPRAAELRPFLASGPDAALRARFAPGEQHVLSAGYDLWLASYPRWGEIAAGGRDDRTHAFSAEYAYRGAFLAAVGYAYSWNGSSAAGGAFRRHRVTARGATELPLGLTLAARASVQWSSYPEPIFIQQQLLLAEGLQNQDAIEVRLTRALGERLEVSVGLAYYADEAGGATGFSRTVASAALGWRGSWSKE